MRGALRLSVGALWLLAAAPLAHAQDREVELGRFEVPVPAPDRSSDFVVLSRRWPTLPASTEVPADALELLGRWSASAHLLRAAILARRTAASEHEIAAADARVAHADARDEAARSELEEVLAEEETVLARPALFLLGRLRWERAARAHVEALDAWDACIAGGGPCPDPLSIADGPARETWARVTGADELGAWASYELGVSAIDDHDDDAGLPLLEAVVACATAPPELAGESAFRLGDRLDGRDLRAAADAFERCAALASTDLAPHCAYRRAVALVADGRAPDALRALAPLLDRPEVPGAAALAADLATRVPTPTSIPAAVRARILADAAERLVSLGLPASAVALLARARDLDPVRAPDALVARYASLAAEPEDLAGWLRRAVALCAMADPVRSLLAFSLDGRITRRGLRARVAPARPPASAELTRCLGRVVVPASLAPTSFDADVVLTAE